MIMNEYEDMADRYISTCRYFICINKTLMGFSKVSGLVMEMDSETYIEGGKEAVPYVMQKKDAGAKVLTLEKGISKEYDNSILSFIEPGCHVDDILIIIIKNTYEIDKAFYIEEGIITKISYSDLDAGSGGIFMITLEISHTGLMEISPDSAKKYVANEFN